MKTTPYPLILLGMVGGWFGEAKRWHVTDFAGTSQPSQDEQQRRARCGGEGKTSSS
jgi:hypothetical protein